MKVKYICRVCKENNVDRVCKLTIGSNDGEPTACIYSNSQFYLKDKFNWKRK